MLKSVRETERDLAEREGSLTAHRANVSRDYLSLMGAEFPENGAAEAVSEKTEAVGKQLDEASIRLEGCQWAQLRIESLEKQLSAQKEIQDSLAGFRITEPPRSRGSHSERKALRT